MDEKCAVVLVTAPSEEKAAAIARALVEERLAACVSLIPHLQSIYRWEGSVHEDAEVLLVVKTLASAFEPLRARVLALHPYQCPEIVLLPIEQGSAPYLAWLRGSVAGP